MRRALYRVGQFGRLLTRRLSGEQLTQVESWLPLPLFELFCRMTPSEQYHAYRVRHTLVEGGQTNPDLLIAALLHDVGKSKMPLAVWERMLIVLGFKFAPSRARQWGAEISRREDATPHLLAGQASAKNFEETWRPLRLHGSIEVGSGSSSWWARPFIVAIHHPEWGAEIVKVAGGSELTVELIRRHQERKERETEIERELLLALQEADNSN